MPNKNPWDTLQGVSMVGSYLPRRCGIATFTADLAESIAAAAPKLNTWAVAMNDRPEGYRYPPRVWFEINQNRLAEYRLAADFLNMSNVDVCCLQHEFGIYGGNTGAHVLELIRRLRMPVVATLHTVLREPGDEQRDIMNQLAEHVDRFVVMADRASEFLTDIYKLPPEKIQVIPHGIPDVPFVDPNYYKDQFGVEGKKVILTFGLLGPSKGIENMIEAMPAIVEKHPDVVYMVLGATHPGVMADQGEDYRLGLKRRAKELGVENNIEWFNKFVELDELVEFLGAADVYVTPYLNEAQITSGTLAYAAGAGKAVVSTPYWHAQELLDDGRGKLVPFNDTEAMAQAITELFDNETHRHAIRKKAYQHTRSMRWSETAKRYLELFATVRDERAQDPRPVVKARQFRRKSAELPEVKLDHLRMLTDSTGLFRYAHATVPERSHGYATDDNARALIAVLMAQDHMDYTAGANLDALVSRYLSYLDHAFAPAAGRFRNLMSFDRRWIDADASEEAHGRALWALGETVARTHVRGHLALAVNLFQQAMPACHQLKYLHGFAYALIGIHAYLRRFSGDSHARRLREDLAGKLFDHFKSASSDNWPWPYGELTYANARLPQALLMSGRWMFNDEMIQQALRSLEWLHEKQTSEDGRFEPIGSDHPMTRNQPKARFTQKPIEAAAAIDAYLEAYHVTGEQKWVDRAEWVLAWFLGDNDLHTALYDNTTGGCHDALVPHGVNQNQGAEATISWLLSLLSLYDHAVETETRSGKLPLPEPQPRPAEDAETLKPAMDADEPPLSRSPAASPDKPQKPSKSKKKIDKSAPTAKKPKTNGSPAASK